VSDQFPGLHASQYNNNYTEAENRDFTARFDAITQVMANAMMAGLPASSEVVQDAVRQHYEFCLQFWVPTRAAYKGLALSYLLPSPYRDSYEAVAEGLGKFTHDAVVIWADNNLD
jgi:hypothetical protein